MNKKELLSILEKVKSGISKDSAIDAMHYFFFTGEEIVIYNNIVVIQYPFKTDFSLFVKATDLFSLLKKIKSEEINLTEKNGKLLISNKTVKATLSTIENKDIVEMIKLNKESINNKWKALPQEFVESVLTCSNVTAKQDRRGTLTCVYVKDDFCIASDNTRIAKANLSLNMEEMFIRSNVAKSLSLINPIEYEVSNSWLHFKNSDGGIFSTRKINGVFPDFLPFFEFTGTKVDFPKEIISGIDVASLFIDKEDPVINIKIKDGVCYTSAKSISGTIKHRAKVKCDIKELEFSVNPVFLKSMMNYSSSIVFNEFCAKLVTDKFQLMISLHRE